MSVLRELVKEFPISTDSRRAMPPKRSLADGSMAGGGEKTIRETYCTVLVRVDIDMVKPPRHQVRETQEDEALRKYYDAMINGRYGDMEDQLISIALVGWSEEDSKAFYNSLLQDTGNNEDIQSVAMLTNLSRIPISEGERNEATGAAPTPTALQLLDKYPDSVKYVDGMHRGHVLKQADVRRAVPWPIMKLHFRRDFKPMTEVEIVRFGVMYNVRTQTNVKVRPGDRVQGYLSLLHLMRQETEKNSQFLDNALYGPDFKKTPANRTRLAEFKTDLCNPEPVVPHFSIPMLYNQQVIGDKSSKGKERERNLARVACGLYKFKDHEAMLMKAVFEVQSMKYLVVKAVYDKVQDVGTQLFLLKVLVELEFISRARRSMQEPPNKKAKSNSGEAVSTGSGSGQEKNLDTMVNYLRDVWDYVCTNLPIPATHKHILNNMDDPEVIKVYEYVIDKPVKEYHSPMREMLKAVRERDFEYILNLKLEGGLEKMGRAVVEKIISRAQVPDDWEEWKKQAEELKVPVTSSDESESSSDDGSKEEEGGKEAESPAAGTPPAEEEAPSPPPAPAAGTPPAEEEASSPPPPPATGTPPAEEEAFSPPPAPAATPQVSSPPTAAVASPTTKQLQETFGSDVDENVPSSQPAPTQATASQNAEAEEDEIQPQELQMLKGQKIRRRRRRRNKKKIKKFQESEDEEDSSSGSSPSKKRPDHPSVATKGIKPRPQRSSSTSPPAAGQARTRRPLRAKVYKDVSTEDEDSDQGSQEEVQVTPKRALPDGSQPVNKPKSADGFTITKQSTTIDDTSYCMVAYDYPKLHEEGFSQLEEHDDVTTWGKWPTGVFKELGSEVNDKNRELRLFEDRDDGRAVIRSNWELQIIDTGSDEFKKVESDTITLPDADESMQRAERIFISGRYQSYCRAIGLRPPHRFVLTTHPSTFHTIRKALYLRLHQIYENKLGLKNVPVSSWNRTDWPRKLMTCKFEGLREKLDTSGFVIIPGLYDPGVEETNLLTGKESSNPNSFFTDTTKLFNYFSLKIPTPEMFEKNGEGLTSEHVKTWVSIRNNDEDPPGSMLKHNRLTTRRQAVVEQLEDPHSKESMELLVAKAQLDASIMMICKWLRLDWETFTKKTREDQGRDPAPLRCPDTGGRFIALVGEEAERQVAHMDEFVPDTAKLAPDGSLAQPSYFSLTTSEDLTPLWVAEGSQRNMCLSLKEQSKIGTVVKMRCIAIPPYSLFIARSDLVHAGAGGKEARGNQCLRYHLYMHRPGLCIGDAINESAVRNYKHYEADAEVDLDKLVRLS